jgi:hypothetical protein
MSIIHINDLFNKHIRNSYRDVNCDYFYNQQYFILSEIYEFNFDARSTQFTYYNSNDPESQAIIFKLDKNYYLSAIDNLDGYRDEVGHIFQLNLSELTQKGLIRDLNHHNIYNSIEHNIVVEAHLEEKKDNQGIKFSIKDYACDEFILKLTTYDKDDYYPNGVIHFDQQLYQKLMPNIEKKLLENQVSFIGNTQKKVKL